MAVNIFDLNGLKVRQIREALGWSREELAHNSGISLRTIQNIETGLVSNPGIETLKPIIEAMLPEDENLTKEQREVLLAVPFLDKKTLEILLSIIRNQSSRKVP